MDDPILIPEPVGAPNQDAEIEATAEVFEVPAGMDESEAARQAARSEFGPTAVDGEFDAAVGGPVDGAVGGPDGPDGPDAESLPVVTIMGRPNVGKSTLVNRILGRRAAVVEDVPGVTRDWVRYDAEWAGRKFILVDTGGWDPRARGLGGMITRQAQTAVAFSDLVILVVDATVGATDLDEEVAGQLRRGETAVILVANKVDNVAVEADAAALWSLGLGEPIPVSGLHGRGSGELLDRVVECLPIKPRAAASTASGLHRVALLGKPNVGKSSLLNALAGSQRVVVDRVAGTTVDPVDEVVMIDDEPWQLVDTAGIRRRVREASGTEWFASLRTKGALARCEAAVLLIDGSEPVSEQDVRIASMVEQAGRALVIAINKWDLVDEERREMLERELARELAQVAWAPRVNISARTGRRVDKLAEPLRESLAAWNRRLGTSELNQFMARLAAAHPHPVRGGRQPRVLFATQPVTGPPTIVLFATRFLEAGYRRFIERRLREEFDFAGTPIRIEQRIRAKRGSRPGSR